MYRFYVTILKFLPESKFLQGFTMLLALMLLPARTAFSQSFVKIDSATYAQYLAGDWSTLVHQGKQAINQGVDYYYLRMRMGIAFYEMKNYRAAIKHFKKALEFNREDPVAQEYLYYSFLYSGQVGRAGVYRDSFNERLSEKLPPQKFRFAEAISIEYLFSTVQNDNIVEQAETYFSGLTSGYQSMTRQFHNASFSLLHRIRPGITLSHAYTYLNMSSFMYYHDGLDVTTVDGQKTGQHQYYLSPSFTSAGGFTLSPSVHFLGIGYQVIGSGGNGFGPGSQVSLIDQRTNAFVGGIALSQAAGPMNITLGGNYSNLNDAKQVLVRGGLTWFPLGNLDLYLGAYLNTQAGITGNTTTYEFIPEYLLGAGIASRIWIEVSGSHGDMTNYLEGNGYIVYNGLDGMKHKISTNLVYPITEKGSKIYLGARWIQYQSNFIPLDGGTDQDINPLTYNGLSMLGGFSWVF